MELLAKILIDYGFKNIDEVIDTLEHGKRKEGDNIFFENAISTFIESIDLIAYQNRLLQSDKDTIKNLMEQIEKLQMRIDVLNKRLLKNIIEKTRKSRLLEPTSPNLILFIPGKQNVSIMDTIGFILLF